MFSKEKDLFIYFFHPQAKTHWIASTEPGWLTLQHPVRSASREHKTILNIFQSLEPHENAKASTSKTYKKDNKQPSSAFPNYLTKTSFFTIPDPPTLTAKIVETDICLSTTSFSSY